MGLLGSSEMQNCCGDSEELDLAEKYMTQLGGYYCIFLKFKL